MNERFEEYSTCTFRVLINYLEILKAMEDGKLYDESRGLQQYGDLGTLKKVESD